MDKTFGGNFPNDLSDLEVAFLSSGIARLALAFQSVSRRHLDWEAERALRYVMDAISPMAGADDSTCMEQLKLAFVPVEVPEYLLSDHQDHRTG